ncbi:hypothetical protein GTV32_04785 [Gordonia sp. SID5947]|uniref:hypothetical protein n=1 Tax=Gordonia sp. SID5947 TaxID=2690315 RepID=UPI00136AB177|nr:hypothetical protein [Gordonia sp. SID5947]MYR05669.1 hypothetical protein [Gordonia sp. SID5947]
MFTCSDPDAAEAAIASTSPSELGEAAREHLRSSRRHEARSLLAAHRLGQAVYDDMVMSLSATGQMRVRNGADKAAIGEISLQLGFSRTKAGTWFNLGDALQRLPKIRRAYLAGDLSTHRMSKMVYAAQTAPEDCVIDLADDVSGDEPDTAPAGADGTILVWTILVHRRMLTILRPLSISRTWHWSWGRGPPPTRCCRTSWPRQ